MKIEKLMILTMLSYANDGIVHCETIFIPLPPNYRRRRNNHCCQLATEISWSVVLILLVKMLSLKRTTVNRPQWKCWLFVRMFKKLAVAATRAPSFTLFLSIATSPVLIRLHNFRPLLMALFRLSFFSSPYSSELGPTCGVNCYLYCRIIWINVMKFVVKYKNTVHEIFFIPFKWKKRIFPALPLPEDWSYNAI